MLLLWFVSIVFLKALKVFGFWFSMLSKSDNFLPMGEVKKNGALFPPKESSCPLATRERGISGTVPTAECRFSQGAEEVVVRLLGKLQLINQQIRTTRKTDNHTIQSVNSFSHVENAGRLGSVNSYFRWQNRHQQPEMRSVLYPLFQIIRSIAVVTQPMFLHLCKLHKTVNWAGITVTKKAGLSKVNSLRFSSITHLLFHETQPMELGVEGTCHTQSPVDNRVVVTACQVPPHHPLHFLQDRWWISWSWHKVAREQAGENGFDEGQTRECLLGESSTCHVQRFEDQT